MVCVFGSFFYSSKQWDYSQVNDTTISAKYSNTFTLYQYNQNYTKATSSHSMGYNDIIIYYIQYKNSLRERESIRKYFGMHSVKQDIYEYSTQRHAHPRTHNLLYPNSEYKAKRKKYSLQSMFCEKDDSYKMWKGETISLKKKNCITDKFYFAHTHIHISHYDVQSLKQKHL